MTLTIREMTEGDETAVLGLLLELTAHEASLNPARTTGPAAAQACLANDRKKAAAHGGTLFVAEQAGEVVGYLALRLERSGPFVHEHLRDHVYIENIVVAASQRGTGVGQALLGQAERFARASGCKVIQLAVLTGNEMALKAYRRAGFDGFALEMAKVLD